MLNQNNFTDKIKQIWAKIHSKYAEGYNHSHKRVDVNEAKREYQPDDKEINSTAPTGDISPSEAQNLVWDNENASMQDKSYSFDESTTDADYDNEDDLNFEDDSSSGQESRYS